MAARKTTPPAPSQDRLHLLSLPYDIRWIIYSHLFPQTQQIYLMAWRKGIHPMLGLESLHMNILLACSQLRFEANHYLYNNYLFNIFGYKKYVMAHYAPIDRLMRQYAKNGSELEILDNGVLSTTACVSIHARGGRAENTVRIRQRGVPRVLEEVEHEAANMPELPVERTGAFHGISADTLAHWFPFAFLVSALNRISLNPRYFAAVGAAMLIVFIAWLYAR